MQDKKRYRQQLLLSELGEAGQEKLLQAKVLVAGAGGLGCPALQYLAAAGIGTIGIVDFDTVDISNLHRQILYAAADVGKPKALVAAAKLKALNPEIAIVPFNMRLHTGNAIQLLSGYDIIIDCTDNFASRYLINDACVLLDKPLIYGAVLRFEGQAGVFNLTDAASGIKTSYRDLFPEPPRSSSVLSCSEAGVIGVIPGIMGIMQASEAIKIITGAGKPLCNRIVSYNALYNSFHEFEVSQNVNTTAACPKTLAEFENFNYDWFCNAHSSVSEISVNEFNRLRASEPITIIDVREKGELPVVDEFSFIHIPLGEFEQNVSSVAAENKIVVFCKSGKRSAVAIELLHKTFPGCTAYSLAGGIDSWKKNKEN